MPRRPGGVSEAELDAVFAQVVQAGSFDELASLVEREPILARSYTHADFNRRFDANARAHPTIADHIRGVSDALFAAIHLHHHRQLLDELDAPDGDTGVFTSLRPPPPLAALVDALGDSLPDEMATPHDLSQDLGGAVEDVVRVTGRPVDARASAPAAGVRWSAMVVGCAQCGGRYLRVHPWWVDLVAAPALTDAVRAGLPSTRCPTCGATRGWPLLPWLYDPPPTLDPLAAMSTSLRLTESVFVYVPPPGTPRRAETDRLMEIRWQAMVGHAPFDPGPSPEDRAMSFGVAYSPAELAGMYRHWVEAPAGEVSLVQDILIGQLGTRLAEGHLPFHEAESYAERFVAEHGSDWKVVVPDGTMAAVAPYRFLASSIVSEAVARRLGIGGEVLAEAARFVASGYLEVGEHALAAQALARAEDVLATVAAPSPGIRASLLDGRADLLRATQRFAESAAARAELVDLVSPAFEHGVSGRRLRLTYDGQALVDVESRGLASVLAAYPHHLDEWRALVDELTSGADPQDAARTTDARIGWSGAIANYGAVLTTAAHWMVAAEAEAFAGDDGQLPPGALETLLSLPIDLAQAATVLPALVEPVEALIGELASAPLYRLARSLLEEAYAISSSESAWEFAAIQAGRLISLCQDDGDSAAAREYAVRTIECGGHVGDHRRVRQGELWLAREDAAAGDVDGAAAHFEGAALETARALVGLGHDDAAPEANEITRSGALLLHDGVDAGRVVAAIEGVRAVRTANAIFRHMPRGGTGAEAARAELEGLRVTAADDPDARRRIADLAAVIEDADRQAALRSPAFARWVDATDVSLATLDDIRALLLRSGPRSVWLSVVHLPDFGGTDLVRTVAIGPDDVSVGEWLQGRLPRGPDWTTEVAAAAGAALLSPHRALLGSLELDDTVVVSLPESLDGMPVGSLLLDDRPLCTWASPVCVHGFGLFEAASEHPARSVERAVLLGGPARTDQADLPGARLEVEAIGSDLVAAGRDALVETAKRATVAALVAAATAADVVHVSCHAVRGPTGDLALLLAADGARHDSGWLTEGRVLSELQLASGALVDLAGCRTGAVEDSAGPVLGGLAPAALVAGARSVVASLWPVDDEAIVPLQRTFYRYLLAGRPPGEALARTQADAWAGRLGPALTRAVHWSAFVVYGAG